SHKHKKNGNPNETKNAPESEVEKEMRLERSSSVHSDMTKAEECINVTKEVESLQQNVKRKIQMLNEAISNLHSALEELDETQPSGFIYFFICIRISVRIKHTLYTYAYGPSEQLDEIKQEVDEAKKLVKEKDGMLAKLKRSADETMRTLEEKEKELEEREKGLNEEVDDITKQNKDLKDRRELLLRECDDVRKQKEHWQQLVEEQKQRFEIFRKQQEELDKRDQEVLGLHRSITEERLKLQEEKKRFLKERHKWEKEKNKQAKYDSGSIQDLAAQQKAMTKPVPSGKLRLKSNNSQPYENLYMMGASLKDARAMAANAVFTANSHDDNASEYAESEYADTIVSDAVTDLESLNSISDDDEEEEEDDKPDGSDHKNKLQRMQLPVNDYE
ncbi:erythrocyte binding protein, partial [Reticulomyxa filosa]